MKMLWRKVGQGRIVHKQGNLANLTDISGLIIYVDDKQYRAKQRRLGFTTVSLDDLYRLRYTLSSKAYPQTTLKLSNTKTTNSKPLHEFRSYRVSLTVVRGQPC